MAARTHAAAQGSLESLYCITLQQNEPIISRSLLLLWFLNFDQWRKAQSSTMAVEINGEYRINTYKCRENTE